jgi:hypothetical protein
VTVDAVDLKKRENFLLEDLMFHPGQALLAKRDGVPGDIFARNPSDSFRINEVFQEIF